MASTTLPNGIIVPEKFSRDWYADLYHNWQELDNLLGASGPGDGTLTIQKNGDTVGTFSANQATDEAIDIEVPTKTSDLNNDSGFITGVSWNDVADKPSFATVATSGSYTDLSDKPTIPTVNNGTLTIQKNGTTVDTFTANSSSDKTVNIQCVDLTSNQTVAGNKEFTGTTTAHDLVPSATDTYNFGSSTNKWKTFNGINPGALSLPNTTGLINIASSITTLDGATINKFTPQVNGWLLINGTGPANDAFIYVAQGRIGAKSTNNASSLRCAVLLPVVAGVEVSVTCKLNAITWANIVPCQGNV